MILTGLTPLSLTCPVPIVVALPAAVASTLALTSLLVLLLRSTAAGTAEAGIGPMGTSLGPRHCTCGVRGDFDQPATSKYWDMKVPREEVANDRIDSWVAELATPKQHVLQHEGHTNRVLAHYSLRKDIERIGQGIGRDVLSVKH